VGLAGQSDRPVLHSRGGARLGLATGQGLTGLVRERFGVRWVTFLTIAMLIANVGSIVAEFAGTAAALSLFHVPARR